MPRKPSSLCAGRKYDAQTCTSGERKDLCLFASGRKRSFCRIASRKRRAHSAKRASSARKIQALLRGRAKRSSSAKKIQAAAKDRARRTSSARKIQAAVRGRKAKFDWTSVVKGHPFFFGEDFVLTKATDEHVKRVRSRISTVTTFDALSEGDPLWAVVWKSYTMGTGPESTAFRALRWFDSHLRPLSTKAERLEGLHSFDYLGGAFSLRPRRGYAIVLTDLRDRAVLRHEVQHVLDDSDDLARYGSTCHRDPFAHRSGNIFYHELRGRVVEKQAITPTVVKDTWKTYCGKTPLPDATARSIAARIRNAQTAGF